MTVERRSKVSEEHTIACKKGRTLVTSSVSESREKREELLSSLRVGVLTEDDLHDGFLCTREVSIYMDKEGIGRKNARR